MKDKSAQFKIQQMAFMLMGIVLFFILVGLFWLSLKSSSINKSAASLAQEQAISLALTIANSPELSCGSQCVDFDKAITVKNTRIFEELWPIKGLEIRKIYPTNTIKECTMENYPECTVLIIRKTEIERGSASSYIKLCRKEKNIEGYNYDKCELGEIIVRT